LNATVLVEYIPRATVRIIIHVSVITERNRKSDEKPREEDYDEQQRSQQINRHSSKGNDHL